MISCFLASLLLCVLAVPAVLTAPTNPASANTTKRYVILDNDWSTTTFIPFLLALDAGFEVLALTTCEETALLRKSTLSTNISLCYRHRKQLATTTNAPRPRNTGNRQFKLYPRNPWGYIPVDPNGNTLPSMASRSRSSPLARGVCR